MLSEVSEFNFHPMRPKVSSRLPKPASLGGRQTSMLGLQGVNFVRGLSESDTPQAAMEIPCVWRVVTQKRETVLFGAEDKGGWSLGADACPGGAVKGVVNRETCLLALFRLSKEEVGEELPGQTWSPYGVSEGLGRLVGIQQSQTQKSKGT